MRLCTPSLTQQRVLFSKNINLYRKNLKKYDEVYYTSVHGTNINLRIILELSDESKLPKNLRVFSKRMRFRFGWYWKLKSGPWNQ